MDKSEIRSILQQVRPYFKTKLGAMTHKRVSSDWYFHALGFVREEMTYVFGFNLGFFEAHNNGYKYVGMSVTVRANGIDKNVRSKYVDFFSENLEGWSKQPLGRYTSARGDEGLLLTRYMLIEGHSPEQMVKFMLEAIDGVHALYPMVVSNSNIFEHVMCAIMPWDEPFVSLAKSQL